jgi:hypothetical protein
MQVNASERPDAVGRNIDPSLHFRIDDRRAKSLFQAGGHSRPGLTCPDNDDSTNTFHLKGVVEQLKDIIVNNDDVADEFRRINGGHSRFPNRFRLLTQRHD